MVEDLKYVTESGIVCNFMPNIWNGSKVISIISILFVPMFEKSTLDPAVLKHYMPVTITNFVCNNLVMLSGTVSTIQPF